MKNYPEYKQLSLPTIDQEVLLFWNEKKIFERSIKEREGCPAFVFYEGPPSANGMPGIHHVMARSIKDIFCRYKTMQGFQVNRKAGWDTHGLPVELSVEKSLGITKEDIGKKITVEQYNQKCREEVMKYQDKWEELTRIMGYWVDMTTPYVTYENNYIESLWWILKQLYSKEFLYKGLSIQPFSPAAGTGLSSHELNQPGCYRMVKDTSAVAQFKLINFLEEEGEIFALAWTTTPWTLPSNTALAVGEKIEYVLVETFNPYTHLKVKLLIAQALLSKFFKAELEQQDLTSYVAGDKLIPWKKLKSIVGAELVGVRYEQLLPLEANSIDRLEGAKDAWRIIAGDFVTTEDGTGMVHIAPSFGADDFRVAALNGIGALTLVDKSGKFVDGVGEFAGRYVKDYKNEEGYIDVNIDICVKLKKENRAFKVEKFEHSYPHCWRTDKPIIYYPLDSWFIAVTKVKEKLVAFNKTINWKPEATGTGRFGNWLENANDWNLSRSRFWGTPLPIWRTEDGSETICIGSIAELKEEIAKATAAGFASVSLDKMEDLDLHKPYVDAIILVSSKGLPMNREADLIDVWFDSGAMPLAQWHYPFENKDAMANKYPADFIAEGVDQTRGWFYTLHTIAVMMNEIDPVNFGGIAYKNVISNGLVLDKDGNKMSKRLGNAVDPFEALPKYGADAIRWYMVENANPWDNLKFDFAGVEETRRKFFGTLFNIYGFFALYANVDGFKYEESEIPLSERTEIDRWIISLLNTLIKEVDQAFETYEPTKAARAIQLFVDEHLSNWYVRLCRRRFWKGEYVQDKIAAYQTLYYCLETISKLMCPIAPFFSEWLYLNLNTISKREAIDSLHLAKFPIANEASIDTLLEERMALAQDISSLVLSLRKKVSIKVRQPLQKIIVPVLNPQFKNQLSKVQDLILSEVNVKELEMITETEGIIKKKIKANFKTLGSKLGAKMKLAAQEISLFTPTQISELEKNGAIEINLGTEIHSITMQDVEILAEDIPGWQVASKGSLTVALDVVLSDNLQNEGIAREIVNQVQKIRKEMDLKVTDRINVLLQENTLVKNAILQFSDYICGEILANSFELHEQISSSNLIDINDFALKIIVQPIK